MKDFDILIEGGKYIVNGKIFYSEAAAKVYIEKKSSPKEPLSNVGKVVIGITLSLIMGFIFIDRSSLRIFINSRLGEAFFNGLLSASILIPVIALLVVIPKFYKNYRMKRAHYQKKIDEAYEEALAEIDDGRIVKKVWAKVYACSSGDEGKVKAEYLKIRAKEIASLK